MSGLFNIPKRNLVFFAVMGFLLWGLYAIIILAPEKSKNYIKNTFLTAGFTSIKIGSVQTSLGGIVVKNIALDPNGMDGIGQIDVTLNWPVFFWTGRPKSVHIQNVEITRTQNELKNFAGGFLDGFLNAPDTNVKLSNAVIDVLTAFGNIRTIVNANIQKGGKNSRDVTAQIASNQFQLGFDSKWQGTLSDDGHFDVYGEILEGRINTKTLKLSRISGWSSLSFGADGYMNQLSLVAGRALFQDLPLQTLSLKAQKTNLETSLILRCGLSGFPDVLLTGDSISSGEHDFSMMTLRGSHLGDVLAAFGTGKEISDNLKKSGAFSVKAQLKPDLRFANGPAPYDITLHIGDNEPMTGNILIYPQNMDIRGSIDVGNDYIRDIKNYFNIPSANIHDGFIRLDQSLAKKN